MKIYEEWVESLSQVGIHPISDDTVAKILAIVYVYGGSMELVFNMKMAIDISYSIKRAKMIGGEVPDVSIANEVKRYIKDIEDFLKNAKSVKSDSPFAVEHPQWVKDFMEERYNIKKMWI
ncbi:hypothetical protein [uncultured Bacteroides sp.]|uniref:hypothetical protein n=1 Tax=uncultured Bacteroides sp. TaxID=162156 RepID=UPI002629EACD|nr:hypothetical protein [uncultured Bacteroides sp.]